MAFLDTTRKILANLIDPNPRYTESLTLQPLPTVSYLPVNAAGSTTPIRKNYWYRLVEASGREIGYTFLCQCGHHNDYWFGKHSLNRQLELEDIYYCSSRCTALVVRGTDHEGLPVYERVVDTEKDKDGNVIPRGAKHCLLDVLPNRGKADESHGLVEMKERERDLVYATLPSWQIQVGARAAQSPFLSIGDQGGNLPGASPDIVGWDDDAIAKEYTRRGDINNGMF